MNWKDKRANKIILSNESYGSVKDALNGSRPGEAYRLTEYWMRLALKKIKERRIIELPKLIKVELKASCPRAS